MKLYNIHTHNIGQQLDEDYAVCSIYNTSPSTFTPDLTNLESNRFSCGIHPWHTDASNAGAELELLAQLAQNFPFVAIGEAGIDKLGGATLAIQKAIFSKQLELAIAVNKPLIIHCVKAWDEIIQIHKQYKPHIDCIIHGYRGNAQQAKQLTDLGFKLSVGIHFNSQSIREIPRNALFLETDVAPIHIYEVYKKVSQALQLEMQTLVDIIAYNVEQTFEFR